MPPQRRHHPRHAAATALASSRPPPPPAPPSRTRAFPCPCRSPLLPMAAAISLPVPPVPTCGRQRRGGGVTSKRGGPACRSGRRVSVPMVPSRTPRSEPAPGRDTRGVHQARVRVRATAGTQLPRSRAVRAEGHRAGWRIGGGCSGGATRGAAAVAAAPPPHRPLQVRSARASGGPPMGHTHAPTTTAFPTSVQRMRLGWTCLWGRLCATHAPCSVCLAASHIVLLARSMMGRSAMHHPLRCAMRPCLVPRAVIPCAMCGIATCDGSMQSPSAALVCGKRAAARLGGNLHDMLPLPPSRQTKAGPGLNVVPERRSVHDEA
eukprot:364586-Chlamydomonas_euryale.AAC.7